MKSVFFTLSISIILGFGLKNFAFEVFTVPTDSMQPTILRGSKIWVNKFCYWGFYKKDIVAFTHNNENFVKRITAMPNDTIYFDGREYSTQITDFQSFKIPDKGEKVDLKAQNIAFYLPLIQQYEGVEAGQVLDKIYIEGKEAQSYIFKNNYFFLQGDNTSASIDSRQWGLIPETAIFGKIL